MTGENQFQQNIWPRNLTPRPSAGPNLLAELTFPSHATILNWYGTVCMVWYGMHGMVWWYGVVWYTYGAVKHKKHKLLEGLLRFAYRKTCKQQRQHMSTI